MKTLLNIPISKLNKTKYIRQLRSVALWIRAKGRGTIEGTTGFGKTFIAFIAIKKMNILRPSDSTIIIVPTIPLKKQWEKQVKNLKLKNTKVYVVNTIALGSTKYTCDLLVVDEIHMMAGHQFSKIFHLCSYRFILGLTATLKRLDGKEVLLERYAPVVDTIDEIEAIKHGWISDYVEINLPVFLSKQEQEELTVINKQVQYYMSKFGDFNIMRQCMNSENAKAYAQSLFKGHSVDIDDMAKKIVVWAVQGYRHIKLRQEYLYKTERKVEAAVELTKKFDLKTITFSQSTQFADEVCNQLGDKAVSYHSNLESVKKLVTKTKKYKTEKGAISYHKKVKGSKLSNKDGTYIVSWKEPKTFGVMTLKQDALSKFKDSRSKINYICTAKALDQGFDAADIELGIDASRTSNPTQHIQRRGRVARNYTYKDGTKKRGIFVNLYIPNSRDEGWLRACQKDTESKVIWVDNLKECTTLIEKILL